MENSPKSQALLSMPFPACNSVAANEKLDLAGMVINPFTDNLVLKKELVQKLHEADEKLAKAPAEAGEDDTTAVPGIRQEPDRVFHHPEAPLC